MRDEPLPEHFESAPEDPNESFMMHLDWVTSAQLWSGIFSLAFTAIFVLTVPRLLTSVDEEGQKDSLGIPPFVFYTVMVGTFLNALSHFYAFTWLRSRSKIAPQKLRMVSIYGLIAVWGLCFWPLHLAMGLLTLALIKKEYASTWFNKES